MQVAGNTTLAITELDVQYKDPHSPGIKRASVCKEYIPVIEAPINNRNKHRIKLPNTPPKAPDKGTIQFLTEKKVKKEPIIKLSFIAGASNAQQVVIIKALLSTVFNCLF